MVEETAPEKPAVRRRRRSRLPILLGFLLLVSLAGNGVLWRAYQQQRASNPEIESARITAEVSRAANLPDEQPAIITVVDKAKLSDATLAREAQNGDKLLVYQKAGKVVIYRPKTKKIINILTITPTSTTVPTSAAPAQPASQAGR